MPDTPTSPWATTIPASAATDRHVEQADPLCAIHIDPDGSTTNTVAAVHTGERHVVAGDLDVLFTHSGDRDANRPEVGLRFAERSSNAVTGVAVNEQLESLAPWAWRSRALGPSGPCGPGWPAWFHVTGYSLLRQSSPLSTRRICPLLFCTHAVSSTSSG